MVADAHVLAAHLVEVVERRAGDGRTGHDDRRQVRHGRQRPRPTDVRDDVLDHGLDLLGRVLVGDRPARSARHHPQSTLQLERVDLQDDAVRSVRQIVARLVPAVDECGHAVYVQIAGVIGLDREAERLHPRKGLRLAGCRAVLDQDVEPRGEAPAGGHLRIDLAQ